MNAQPNTLSWNERARSLAVRTKQSGMGRDKSLHALGKYTELKTTWLDLS